MITKTHDEHCPTCDWLGREAERTAAEYGQDGWTSTTTERGGAAHTARFEADYCDRGPCCLAAGHDGECRQ